MLSQILNYKNFTIGLFNKILTFIYWVTTKNCQFLAFNFSLNILSFGLSLFLFLFL